MLAKAQGVVWEVTQTGTGDVDGKTMLWVNLVPLGGGEKRAAYSPWTSQPSSFLLDGEPLTFEG